MSRCLLYDSRRQRFLGPPTFNERRQRARDLVLEQVLTGHSGCINSIEFSDDASLLITGSDDTHVCLYDTGTWTRRAELSTSHIRNIFNAVMVPGTGGAELISCGLDGRTCLCRVREGTGSLAETDLFTNKILMRDNSITSRIVFTAADSRTAYVARSSGNVAVIDLRLERLVDEFAPMHRDMARSSNTLATSPVHPYVIACGTDLPPVAFVDTRYLKPEDAAFLRVATPFAMHSSGIGGLSFNSTGSRVVCSYKSSDVFAYDWLRAIDHADRRRCDPADVAWWPNSDFGSQFTNCEAKRYVGRSNKLTMFKEATYFDDDRFVVTGGDCGNVFVWDAESTKLLRKIKADSDIVNGVLTHPALPNIVACGIDDTAKVIGLTDRATGAPSAVTRPQFSPPRTRRRFAADSDEESTSEEDVDVGEDVEAASPTDGSSDADSESLSLRATVRSVALLQLQIVEGEIPTTSRLLQHLRLVARLVRTAAAGGEFWDGEEDSDEEAVAGEEEDEEEEADDEEHGSDEEVQAAARTSSSSRGRHRHHRRHAEDSDDAAEEEEGESAEEDEEEEEDASDHDGAASDSVPRVTVTTPDDSDDSESAGRDASAALFGGDILGGLLFALHKYRGYLDQVRTLCAKRGALGPHEAKVRFGTMRGGPGPEMANFWEVLTLFADIVHTTLDQKFVLADDDATRESWCAAFTEASIVKALIAAAEADTDRALALLANCAAQTDWTLPLLTATVAIGVAGGASDALVAARLAELKDALRRGHGNADQRAHAKRVVRANESD